MSDEQQAPEQLLPCPKCNDCWALTQTPQQPPLLPPYVRCGRCGFNAPLKTWQARIVADLAPVAQPPTAEVDTSPRVSAKEIAEYLVDNWLMREGVALTGVRGEVSRSQAASFKASLRDKIKTAITTAEERGAELQREVDAKIKFAFVVPVGHSYSVSVGTQEAGIGIRVCERLIDAKAVCDGINAQIAGAIRAAKQQ